MAIQEWTILTLAGPAAGDAVARLQRWWRARVFDEGDDGRDGYSSREWSPAIQREAAAYLARLVEHRWEMPIVYFSRHLDLWSIGAGAGIAGPSAEGPEPVVLHDNGQLWCLPLKEGCETIDRWREIAEGGHYPESRWRAQRIVEAAEAYQGLWSQRTLLLNRQAVAPSDTEDEMKQGTATLPTWLEASLTTEDRQ